MRPLRFEWLKYAEAGAALTWDSNRIALFELHHRLRSRKGPELEQLVSDQTAP